MFLEEKIHELNQKLDDRLAFLEKDKALEKELSARHEGYFTDTSVTSGMFMNVLRAYIGSKGIEDHLDDMLHRLYNCIENAISDKLEEKMDERHIGQTVSLAHAISFDNANKSGEPVIGDARLDSANANSSKRSLSSCESPGSARASKRARWAVESLVLDTANARRSVSLGKGKGNAVPIRIISVHGLDYKESICASQKRELHK